MPKVNIYNIVTNDDLELPVACDLIGARAVGDFLGMTAQAVNRCVCYGHWSRWRKLKAVIVDQTTIRLSDEERLRRVRDYSCRYYDANAERLRADQRRRYWLKKGVQA
jgi:hypothetical protein